jgi:hypothetical protein
MELLLSTAQKNALTDHRRRRRDRGIVRVEVQAPSVDAGLLKDVAAILRGDAEAAQAMRAQLRSAIANPRAGGVFDIFGSDLPDDSFEGVFETTRQGDMPRDVDL